MSPPRPARLVVVTGTGTEIGKTWVAAALAMHLRAEHGRTVAARKPAQSFAPDDLSPTDADRLAAACGEPAEIVCPPHRRYPRAMAPPMAAAALGAPRFTIGDLAGEVTTSWPARAADVGLVEGAGGVAAPQADDGDTVELIGALRPDLVVLVAPPGLGTINLVRLSVAALAGWPVVVHLNPWTGTGLEPANRDWLVARDGLPVTLSVAALAEAVIDERA